MSPAPNVAETKPHKGGRQSDDCGFSQPKGLQARSIYSLLDAVILLLVSTFSLPYYPPFIIFYSHTLFLLLFLLSQFLYLYILIQFLPILFFILSIFLYDQVLSRLFFLYLFGITYSRYFFRMVFSSFIPCTYLRKNLLHILIQIFLTIYTFKELHNTMQIQHTNNYLMFPLSMVLYMKIDQQQNPYNCHKNTYLPL